MRSFCESTLSGLFQSAVDAFPNTTRRQHVVAPIKISNLQIIPFVGMKTLFLKVSAFNEGREYNPIILIKRMHYQDAPGKGIAEIAASDGQTYYMKRPILSGDDVLLRCKCADFFWRFNYFDHLDRSLYSRKRRPYVALHNPGSANPLKMPGMCKHIMKMMEVLVNTGIIMP